MRGIFYDKEKEMVYVKDKTINYVLASAKKKDYDIIAIPSVTKEPNAILNIKYFDKLLKFVKSGFMQSCNTGRSAKKKNLPKAGYER